MLPTTRVTEIRSLAVAANDILTEYVAIHNDIFNSSLSRTIRRLIPIPGLFQAIPYETHAQTLCTLRSKLCSLQQEVAGFRASTNSNPPSAAFLSELQRYCSGLDDTLSRLQALCDQLALRADGAPGPSWRKYKSELEQYEQSRQRYGDIGVRLNDLFRVL